MYIKENITQQLFIYEWIKVIEIYKLLSSSNSIGMFLLNMELIRNVKSET